MKKLLLFSVFALLNFATYSCTADDSQTSESKTEIKKNTLSVDNAKANIGPDDDPITVPPPPKKP